jgi:hypothetical protein
MDQTHDTGVRMRRGRWLLLALAATGLIVSPAMGGAEAITLAQVVDTGGVQSQSVSDVLETMKEWKLLTLGIAMLLVGTYRYCPALCGSSVHWW